MGGREADSTHPSRDDLDREIDLEDSGVLALLYAMCALESLDVVVLLLHDDASNLRLCKSLHAIDRAFPELRAHEPSPLHLLARLNEPSYEGVYHEHLYREIPIS